MDSCDDTIAILLMLGKSCPFFFHTKTGHGTPSAVQLNDTFCPLCLVTNVPVLFNMTALTKNKQNSKLNLSF